RGDVFQASTTHLHANDKVTADDLLHLLLIASDNAAARALARVSPYGTEGFVPRMNEKAAELGLENTHYADPSGLLSDNVSSARDRMRAASWKRRTCSTGSRRGRRRFSRRRRSNSSGRTGPACPPVNLRILSESPPHPAAAWRSYPLRP